MSEIKQSTMRPLLTRLRDRPKDHLLLHEAAAEIERLNADLASSREQLADLTKRWGAVVDDRDRLRAALHKIANPNARFEGQGECEAIARAALQAETGRNDCIACSVGNPGVYIKDGRMVCPHRPE